MTKKTPQTTNPTGGILFLLLLLLGGIFLRPGKLKASDERTHDPIPPATGHDKEGVPPSAESPTPETFDTENQDTITPDPGNEANGQEIPAPEFSKDQIIIEKSVESPPAVLPAGNSADSNGKTGKKTL